MAKFCVKCGSSNVDHATVCGRCGNILMQGANANKVVTSNVVQQKLPSNRLLECFNKYKKLLGAAVVIMIAIIIGCNVFGSPSTPEGILKEYVKALNNRDAEKLTKIMMPSSVKGDTGLGNQEIKNYSEWAETEDWKVEIYDDITATAPGRVDDILRMEPEEAAWGRVCFEGENSGGAKIIIYKYDGEWYCREGDL